MGVRKAGCEVWMRAGLLQYRVQCPASIISVLNTSGFLWLCVIFKAYLDVSIILMCAILLCVITKIMGTIKAVQHNFQFIQGVLLSITINTTRFAPILVPSSGVLYRKVLQIHLRMAREQG
jgi:hypothetical protein